MMRYFFLLLIICGSISGSCQAMIKSALSHNTSTAPQEKTLEIQFDVVRIVTPTVISNTTNPESERAYLPTCPPGSRYVSGVKQNMILLDYGPNYPYCNCFCHGNCNSVPGVSSPGGSLPIYMAKVTCAIKIQKGVPQHSFLSHNIPHQYSYCQAGNCTTRPLPANLNFYVSNGGFQQTTQVNFQSCATAFNSLCGAPDQTSLGRTAGTIP